MLRCVGTPRVYTHDAFHTPRPFVHSIKITISLCKKRTSVNFEHTYFLNHPLMMTCHMYHMYHIMYFTENYEMYPWGGGWGGITRVNFEHIFFESSSYFTIRDRSQLTSTTDGVSPKS